MDRGERQIHAAARPPLFEDARPLLDAMAAADRRALLARLARRHATLALGRLRRALPGQQRADVLRGRG